MYWCIAGIVPVSSETLFTEIEAKRENAAKGEEYQVTFSMLEIYNEQVRDLLNPKSNVKGGLKVREKPGKGFYGKYETIKIRSDISRDILK